MFTDIVAQSSTVKSYKYFLRLNNRKGNIQTLIADFDSIPSFQDWQTWLSVWSRHDYYLSSSPVLLTK